MMTRNRPPSTLLIFAATLSLSACGARKPAEASGRAAGGGPTEVGFVVARAVSVPSTSEAAGRIAALEQSEVRPQVGGIVQRRVFTEGSFVRAGQTLYQIDPSLYRAAADEAAANIASARATASAAEVRANRLRPLAQAEAVAQQDYTDAAAQARAARATVAQNAARLDTARVNLRFTRVPAPISGRIGRSLVTQGALVTANQVEPLAVIQRLDPVYVDIQQSSSQLLALRRALATGTAAPATAQVRLLLEDGSEYPYVGSVPFAESIVDPATGTVTLRARVANPQGLLLPGMFVRARFVQSIDTSAFLVPQQAVSRDPQGNARVFLVGPGNRALAKKVTATRTQGAFWVVTDGLAPGDRVIVQGLGRLKPNAPIRPVPATAPQRIVPKPNAGSGGAGARGG